MSDDKNDQARAEAQRAIAGLVKRTATELEEGRPYEHPKTPEPLESLEEILAMGAARVKAQDERRRALPCMVAIYPRGAPEGYLEETREHGELVEACRACDKARAWEGCDDRSLGRFCAQELISTLYETTRHKLRRGEVEEREFKIIMAAVKRDGAVPLRDEDTLRIVRAFLTHRRCNVVFDDAAELNALTGEPKPGVAHLAGGERVLVLAGNPGRGKTIAATYAIGRIGGRYITEYILATPSTADVPSLKRQPGVLVIDQVGRARLGEKRTAALVLEEIVDARYASKLDTILCANMPHQDFVDRYKQVLLDRIAGDGAFILFSGDSMRPHDKEVV